MLTFFHTKKPFKFGQVECMYSQHNIIYITQMIISVLDRVENIVGTGENAGYQHFLLFLQCFQKPFFLNGRFNSELYGKELT